MKEFLLIPSDETETEEDEEEEEEEFYDVKSVSDTEIIENHLKAIEEVDIQHLLNDSNVKTQLKLIPNLTKIINKTITRIIEETQGKTRKYLEEYCEMQKEMIFCNEPEYIEAFRNYFNGRGKGGGDIIGDLVRSSNDILRDDLIRGSNPNVSGIGTDLVSRNSSIIDFHSSISDDLPLKRIQSESIETVTKQEEESSGFLKEFLALLFPNVKNTKRVEYRPKNRVIINKKTISSSSSSYADTTPVTLLTPLAANITIFKSVGRDEEFLLKLLEIYLKSHHRQLSDFLPKCINYHLIHETLKQLSMRLLKSCNIGGIGDGWLEEIKRIERILKMIEEINI